MRHIGAEALAELKSEATQSPRGRAHLLLHETAVDAQRIVIALTHGSRVSPHYHPTAPTWSGDETLAVLHGTVTVTHHTYTGTVLHTVTLRQGDTIHIPGGQPHGLAAVSDAVLLEVKPGNRPDPDRIWLGEPDCQGNGIPSPDVPGGGPAG